MTAQRTDEPAPPASTPLKQRVVNALFWNTFQVYGHDLVRFVVGIILARLLAPSEFGTVAIVTVFVTLSHLFIDSGFGLNFL